MKFLSIFIKKIAKKGFLPVGADVARRELRADMARGTTSRCDAALRPRGRAQVARARRRWRWRVAGGHADAREGRHVACEGLQVEGPRV